MKKLITSASPFLMLLVPVFVCLALLTFAAPAETAPGKVVSLPAVHLPTFQTLIRAAF